MISFPNLFMIIARKSQPKMYRKFKMNAFKNTESASFVTQIISVSVELLAITVLVSSRIVQTGWDMRWIFELPERDAIGDLWEERPQAIAAVKDAELHEADR